MRCSYLEIYNEEIRDLLGSDTKQKLDLREDPGRGVYVKDLTTEMVSSEETITALMERGQAHRTTGSTLMNQTSSRSHSIFTIVIEMNEADSEGKDHIRVGKLNLVDLAGSERQSKTGATGDRLKEGCKINLSLSALGNVISALVEGKGKHVPYRDSKLTRLLQDSLGGNTKTLMVAAISPADYNYDETMSTLRYANRAKNIKNKPRINEDPKDAMLRQYKEEIERLKSMLSQRLVDGEGLPITTAAIPAPSSETAILQNSHEHSGSSAISGNERLVEVKVEVVPEHLKNAVKRAEAMEEYSRAMEQQKIALGAQLKAKDEQVIAERVLREELTSKLDELQRGIIGMQCGGEAAALNANQGINPPQEDAEVIIAKQHQDSRRMAAKLRRQKKKEAQLKAEQLRIEQERAQEEGEMRAAIGAAEDEASRLKKSKRRLERKFAELRAEMADMHVEQEREREEMMENTRELSKELLLWEQVVRLLLPTKEISRVWERAEYNEAEELWDLPRIRPRSTSVHESSYKLPSLMGDSSFESPTDKNRRKPPAGREKASRNAVDGFSHGDESSSCAPSLVIISPSSRVQSSRGSRISSRSAHDILPDVRPGTRSGTHDRSVAAPGGAESWGFSGSVGAPSSSASGQRDRCSSRQGQRRTSKSTRRRLPDDESRHFALLGQE